MTRGRPEDGTGARRRPSRRRLLAGILAIAAIAAVGGSLAMAGNIVREDLAQPSIATDDRGLSTVAWTEIAQGGIRVSQQTSHGRWSRPELLDAEGGPGSVAVGRDRLAHIAYTAPRGLVVADQQPGDRAPPVFRKHLIDRDGTSRPSIAIAPNGSAAVLYETGAGTLRLARRAPTGRWRIGGIRIPAAQPRIAAGRDGSLVGAGMEGNRIAVARVSASGRIAAAGATSSSGRVRGFDLALDRGRPLISYIDEKLQVVIVARPGQTPPLQVIAATSAIGDFTALAATPSGRSAVLYREPRYGLISLSVMQGASRSPVLATMVGRSGDIALGPGGKVAHIALWDPAGLRLLSLTVPLKQAEFSPAQPIFSYQPGLVRFRSAPISALQRSLPTHDKVAIWLASLALLLTVAAGSLLLVERRRGIRLLPFGIVLAVLAGYALRGAYLAQVGVYGLPPNDLLPLDRAGVEAVVEALLILTGSAAIICLTGFLVPAGLGSRALGKLGGISLPTRRGARWALAAFLLISLAIGLHLVADAGLKQLFESRQTAFAGAGYQLALLAAGAGAWLVYFAIVGWPGRGRERTILLGAAAITLVPLILSGARSVVILGFLVPIGLLIHLRIRPISLRAVLIGAVILVAFAIGSRELTRGGTSSTVLTEAVDTNGPVVKVLKPVFGWTEAAGLDALVLVRNEYVPRFGTDPLQTPGPYLGIAVPRSVWPGKPRSAMDTFSDRLNPWNYGFSRVGKTTTLAGEFDMGWGLAGIFVGFVLFSLLLTVLGELLGGAGGIVGILIGAALLPRVGAAFWGDSFNAGWGGLVLVLMIGLAILAGRIVDRRAGGGSQQSAP